MQGDGGDRRGVRGEDRAKSGPAELPGADEAGFDARGTARTLLRTTRAGALASLDPAGGHPLATLVSLATDIDGAPLMLLSQLSAHRTNLECDPRASLLLAAQGKGDPLAHPRLSLIGRVSRIDDANQAKRARSRFLARHPKAKLYADFTDFGWFRMDVERGHLNGGFARAAALTRADLILDLSGAEALIAAHDGAVAHMNEDHADALTLYATRLADPGQAAGGVWRTTGLDPEGIDLACGDRCTRLPFPVPVTTPDTLRTILADLARKAREA
ncbi:MAG: HugZ family protein [Salinarimonas sp.]|nr:HugZ family protein [Salinarimonas sp.]